MRLGLLVAALMLDLYDPHDRRTRQHSHRCPFDGTVWSHGEECRGNRDLHRCPECGYVQWSRI